MKTRTVFMAPVSIFGNGSSDDAGTELKALGAYKVFIVTDETLVALGSLTRVFSSLEEAGLEYELYDSLPTEPTVEFVVEGTRLFKESRSDLILAVGGGTPIDTAKAISIMATNAGSIEDYMGANKVEKPGIPLVAIPATAGTGS